MTEPQIPLSDDELLSAYLDGELAGDDLARAERLLAEQPASRQLLAELRALGDALRKLPRGQLGEDFPERVLRKAERQLLSESQVSDAKPTDREPARWRNKRPWIYAVASLAAGLLVAIISLPHQSVKHSASADAGRSTSESEGIAADKLARQTPGAGAPIPAPAGAATPSLYPPAMAASKSAAGANLAASPAPPESPVALKTALAQFGFAPADADEIVQQLQLGDAQSPAAEPLTVWSLSVDADTLEHDRLGGVLAHHDLQVLEQRPLSRETTAAADAASAHPPASKPSASHAPVMAVLVAGSPDQLKATLADLRSQSDTFQRLTDLGRQSLRAEAAAAGEQQTAPGLQAGPAGAGGADRKDEALKERAKSRRARSADEVQVPTEWALFILRRAEPGSPARPEAAGKKAAPVPTKQGKDEK